MLMTIIRRSLNNLMLPKVMKLLMLCVLAYLVVGFGFAFGLGELVTYWAGLAGTEGFILSAISRFGGLALAWFLFPLLFPVFVSFFDDYVVEAIEREDYPLVTPANPPFWPTLMQDIWFSVKALSINILLLPVYFLLPGIGQLIYYGLNGYLLGMQFFRMSAGRRLDRQQTRKLSSKYGFTILSAGVLLMLAATIPLLNLVAPILCVAAMLHLYHLAVGNDKQVLLPPEVEEMP